MRSNSAAHTLIREVPPSSKRFGLLNFLRSKAGRPSESTGHSEISVKDFLAFPSPTKLLQLDHSGDLLLEELGEDKMDVDKVVATIMKVALVVSKDDEAKIKACECADRLLHHLFNNVENAGGRIVNAFLVSLGLIKGEDKKYSAPKNITGPLLVLEHVAKQNYFPVLARQILLAFIIRPHPSLEKSSDARHKILQTLYAF